MRACNNLPQPPKAKDVGIGLRKIVACSHSSQCLLVSTVFGTVSSLHPTSFLMIFTLVSLIFYPGLALTVARGEIVSRATRICVHVRACVLYRKL